MLTHDHIIEMSRGSYSYLKEKKGKPNEPSEPIFKFRDFHFQIQHVNDDAAAIVFIDDPNNGNIVDIPKAFTLYTGVKEVIKRREEFTIIWLHSYELKFNGVTIWKLSRQKQQSISIVGIGSEIEKVTANASDSSSEEVNDSQCSDSEDIYSPGMV
jgi:hypothetical protein